jgi:hypothetical protein
VIFNNLLCYELCNEINVMFYSIVNLNFLLNTNFTIKNRFIQGDSEISLEKKPVIGDDEKKS